jgi:hypothetical protein
MEPKKMNRIMLAEGIGEKQIRELEAEFASNSFSLSDEELIGRLMDSGVPVHSIINIFDKAGIGRTTAIRIISEKQVRNLEMNATIYSLEVRD